MEACGEGTFSFFQGGGGVVESDHLDLERTVSCEHKIIFFELFAFDFQKSGGGGEQGCGFAIGFLQIRIELFFQRGSRSSFTKLRCDFYTFLKISSYEDSHQDRHLEICFKTKKFFKKNTISILTISMYFFCYFFSWNFSILDPDLHFECGSRRAKWSGSTARWIIHLDVN